jgi:hypothetical protein
LNAAMNKKQRVLTIIMLVAVICLLALSSLGTRLRYPSQHHTTTDWGR